MRPIMIFPGFCLAAFCALTFCCRSFGHDPALFDDESFIAAEADSYSYVRRTLEWTADGFSLGFSGFSGKDTIWLIDAEPGCTIPLELSLGEDIRGSFKICVVSPEGRVTTVADPGGSVSIELPLSAGRHRFTLVGYLASGSISVRVPDGLTTTRYAVRGGR
jgi:hypothetical protein